MELFLDLKKRYTYADYLTWADDKVCELIDGFIKTMSPKPKPKPTFLLRHSEVY